MGFFSDISDAFAGSVRLLQSSAVFLKNGGAALLDAITKDDAQLPVRLRQSFTELGATYIKLGQLIASAPGIFPADYVKEMQQCLDNIAPMPFSDVEKVLQQEFKGRQKEIFRTINPVPLASASIAQVHAATLADGADVVIKVQRPGIETKLNADMNLIYLAVIIFEKITPGANRAGLRGIVEQFQQTIAEEVDFIKEAANIHEFANFLDAIAEPGVIVPKVYSQASTLRVLTMQRLYGKPLTDLETVKKYSRDPRKTLELALSVWFQSLALCGFFHADVHAGNLLILEDGKVAFIDFGIVGRFSAEIFEALLGLVSGFAEKNPDTLADALINLNATHGKVDRDKFRRELVELISSMEKLGDDILKQTMVDETRLNQMVIQLVQITENNGLKIPRELALLFKQFLYFDRYVQALAPDMQIMQTKYMPKQIGGGRRK